MGAQRSVSSASPADPAIDRGAQRRTGHALAAEDAASIWIGPGRCHRGEFLSSYLGPVVRVRSGDTIPFRVENRLDEETTLHWHGLLVPSHVDGGPHNTIRPGGVWSPEITVRQPRGDDVVPSAPAREHGPAGLCRTCRHDDRQRRRRPRPWPARDLRHRRSADRAPGQALRTQW